MALSVTNMLTDFTQRGAVPPLNGSEPLLEWLVADLRYADHCVLMLGVIRLQALVPVVHGPLLLVFMGQHPLQLLFCHALSHYIALAYGLPTRVIALDVDLRHSPISIDCCVQHRLGDVLGATRRGLRVVAPPLTVSPASPREGGTDPQPQPNEAQHCVPSEHPSSADATATADRAHSELLPKAVEERDIPDEAVYHLRGCAEVTFERNTLLHSLRPSRIGTPTITAILTVIIVLVGVNWPGSSKHSSSVQTDPGALYIFCPTCPAETNMCSWYDHEHRANPEGKTYSTMQVLLDFSATITPHAPIPPGATRGIQDVLSNIGEQFKTLQRKLHNLPGYSVNNAGVESQEQHSQPSHANVFMHGSPKEHQRTPSHHHRH